MTAAAPARTILGLVATSLLALPLSAVHAREIVELQVAAPSLQGNLLGEASERRVAVYLPPGYAGAEDERYPLVVLLHAWGSTPESFLDERAYEGLHLAEALDRAIGEGEIQPLIVALPDLGNRFGGAWAADSEATGDWSRFLAIDLPAGLAGAVRTLEQPRSRGIAGQSMGAYNALRVVLEHPGAYGAVAPISAPNLGDPAPFGAPGFEAALELDPDDPASASVLARLLWSKAVAFAPDAAAPPLFARLPYRRTAEGLVRDDALWERWLESGLIHRVPAAAADLRELAIHLEIGARDPLRADTLALAAKLAEHEVPHELVVFDGDHSLGVRRRLEVSVFHFFDRVLHR